MEREKGVPPSIFDEHHSSAILRDKMEGEVVLLEASLMNFILQMWSNER